MWKPFYMEKVAALWNKTCGENENEKPKIKIHFEDRK